MLYVRKAGGDATGASSVFLKIELEDVLVSSVQFEGAIQGDDRPAEDVTSQLREDHAASTTHLTARSTSVLVGSRAEQDPVTDDGRAAASAPPAPPSGRFDDVARFAPRSTRPGSRHSAVRKALHADADLLSTAAETSSSTNGGSPRRRRRSRRSSACSCSSLPVAVDDADRALAGPGAGRSSTSVSPRRRTACSAASSVSSRTTISWSRRTSPAPAAPNHVAGVHRPSATLAELTVRRPVEAALDVATGCGIQALLTAPHAGRVVATDVNERALAFAEFNAALNGIENVEFRAGSFFEPAAGERFGPRRVQPALRHLPGERRSCSATAACPATRSAPSSSPSCPRYLEDGGVRDDPDQLDRRARTRRSVRAPGSRGADATRGSSTPRPTIPSRPRPQWNRTAGRHARGLRAAGRRMARVLRAPRHRGDRLRRRRHAQAERRRQLDANGRAARDAAAGGERPSPAALRRAGPPRRDTGRGAARPPVHARRACVLRPHGARRVGRMDGDVGGRPARRGHRVRRQPRPLRLGARHGARRRSAGARPARSARRGARGPRVRARGVRGAAFSGTSSSTASPCRPEPAQATTNWSPLPFRFAR